MLALEEPLPHVVLLEQRNVRPVQETAALDRETEHPLERGELAVDRRVGGAAGRLPMLDEPLDIVGRDLRHASATKPGLEPERHPALDMVQ